MKASRPGGRAAALAGLTLAVLAPIVWWAWDREPPGFATPAECLDASCNAAKDGKAELYLACLAEPLRSETRRRFQDREQLAEHLRLRMQDVTGWVLELRPEDGGAETVVELVEVRESVRRRTRFHLARTMRGWLITNFSQPIEEPVKPAD